MDFDEFCLALRFVYASINGEISEIPAQLPPQMIPASKAHYFGGNQGYGNQSYMTQAHMSPAQYGQSANYSAIADLVCDNLARRTWISSWNTRVVLVAQCTDHSHTWDIPLIYTSNWSS